MALMFILLLQGQTLSATKQISFIEGFLSHVSMDFNAPLTSEELRQLEALMEGQSGMRLPRLHGYLTGVISAPLLAMPDAWLPWIWDEGPSLQRPSAEMEKSIPLILHVYKTIVEQFKDREEFSPLLSLNKEPYEQASANTMALQQWCQGYLVGIQLEAEGNLPTDKYIAPFYLPILVLASDEGTVRQRLKDMLKEIPLDEVRQMSVEMLPMAIAEINAYWREQEWEEPVFHKQPSPKIGRNDPCPCGSGKKFKKCCWQQTLN
jgi:uncharacterized protein